MNYEAFYKISYGLYVVSSGTKDNPNGYVANTAFQVTADPPQLAISCNKKNHTASLIEETGHFSISVLKQEAGTGIIRSFGYETGTKVTKFDKNVDFIIGKSGSPILLTDCVAWFDCKVTMKFEVGSHILFVGEVIDNALTSPNDDPLTYEYYRNVKRGRAPENAPTFIDKSKLTEPKTETKKEVGVKCLVCGYKYDPEIGDPDGGIAPGTPFEDIPDDWVCPVCGATKDMFEVV